MKPAFFDARQKGACLLDVGRLRDAEEGPRVDGVLRAGAGILREDFQREEMGNRGPMATTSVRNAPSRSSSKSGAVRAMRV